jgi:hypothetical protein
MCTVSTQSQPQLTYTLVLLASLADRLTVVLLTTSCCRGASSPVFVTARGFVCWLCAEGIGMLLSIGNQSGSKSKLGQLITFFLLTISAASCIFLFFQLLSRPITLTSSHRNLCPVFNACSANLETPGLFFSTERWCSVTLISTRLPVSPM